MPVTVDTLKFSKRLQAAGMPASQAEAFAEAFGEAAGEGLASKQDISELRLEMAGQIADLREQIAGLRQQIAGLQQQITGLREQMATKADLAELRADLIRWNVGTIIAAMAVFAAIVKLL
jgi:DNA-binding transcriptional MerR regulator